MKKIQLLFAFALMLGTPVAAQEVLDVYDENLEKEEVIGVPESMTATAFDSLLNKWHNDSYFEKDNDCFTTNDNPEFDEDTYIQRLSNLPTIIEMPYNSVVRKFIDQYAGRLRRTISYMLGANQYYDPIFENALDAYGLPQELKYLPIIESALNPKATSRAGAAGLWQFMTATGKRYGLEVNSLVDERRDPIRASYAAAHYLKDLYRIYNDWTLVIAAYNCGPGNVNKAIHRAKEQTDYWQIYPYLPQETRGYVPAFIAVNYMMTYYAEHNICPMKMQEVLKTDTLMVNKNLDLRQIAELCNTNIDVLYDLNPQYRTTLVPGDSQPRSVCLPQTAVAQFISYGDSIYNYRADEWMTKRRTVEVAQPSYERDYATNTRSSRSSRNLAAKKQRGRSITVRRGDTLASIAKRNNTTVKELKRRNGIRGNNITAGKKLVVR